MSEEKKQIEKKLTISDLREGYQPLKKNFQHNKGNLDPSNPPQGGTGLSSETTSDSSSNEKKDE